jgi:RNA polymerase sigma-70 factor (ECF subfamily)
MTGTMVEPCPAPLNSLSEEDLAVRVQGGCAESYAELDRRLRPRLCQALKLRLGNGTDAEDVAQLSLMKAYKNIDRFDPERRFSPWMFTIALRLANDFQQRRRLQPTTLEENLLDAIAAAPEPAEPGSGGHDIWQIARETLSREQAAALWLFYGEDQSVKDIARGLGRTVVSVRVMLYRARKKLLPRLYTAEVAFQSNRNGVPNLTSRTQVSEETQS